MSTPETDSILKECLLDYGKITEIISLCQKMERELNDIYSHLSATVPTEQRKAFLISIINQYKFNERGHDKIPRGLPCLNPYLLSDRVQINRTKSNG
jgi:rubrerythrin